MTFITSKPLFFLITAALMNLSMASQPNIIICMSDDQGWGDVAYNGHPVLRTPHLDQMAAEGLRFDHFYATTPVCSPTRAGFLTGRHPYRYGIRFANIGRLEPEEITIPELLKKQGYRTGHFGKWHLGTMTTKIVDGHHGRPGQTKLYSPPWENGYDECFAAESGVHTYHHPGSYEEMNTRYWTALDTPVPPAEVSGDDSKLIMNHALDFIKRSHEEEQPFFTTIWFHSPHQPVVSAPPYTDGYEEHKDYYGCITAMDEQMGRLRAELKKMGVAQNTMLWFCSDNGPTKVKNSHGSAGGLRGGKRQLYEGGIRVPGLLIWPEVVPQARVSTYPCSTSDFLPTFLDLLDIPLPSRPYDGVSLMPLLKGESTERPQPLHFEHPDTMKMAFAKDNPKNQTAIIDQNYKLISMDGEKSYALYDLEKDPAEQQDLSQQHPKIFTRLKENLEQWRKSCRDSASGLDY